MPMYGFSHFTLVTMTRTKGNLPLPLSLSLLVYS